MWVVCYLHGLKFSFLNMDHQRHVSWTHLPQQLTMCLSVSDAVIICTEWFISKYYKEQTM